MILTRRRLLKTASLTAGAVVLVNWVDRPEASAQALAAARGAGRFDPLLDADECRAFAEATFSQARTLGCAYADLRITRVRTGTAATEQTNLEIAVRVRHSGAWGSAERRNVAAQCPGGLRQAIAHLTAQAVADAKLTARRERPARCSIADDRWVMPRRTPRSPSSARHQRDIRRAVIAATSRCSAVHGEETYFVSTTGSYHHTTRLSVT